MHKRRILSLKGTLLSRLIVLERNVPSSSISNDCHPDSKWKEPTGYKTDISVYNSAIKRKVPFILRHVNYATWYMCGPTVYDSAHLGHACCYVKFDIIRRILQNFFDIQIVLVMGITDIDDKIINKALELKEDVNMVSRRYENEFFKDISTLNILAPTITVRVTDVIPNIVEFIENIIKKGLAYRTNDGSVYFDTTKYKLYGKFCSVPENSNISSHNKKSNNDFALWKAAKSNEPFWNSPWGKGRPGWHIECSTIASQMLGSTIDLHSGGIDLLFPHHENEEAQSCAYHGVGQWVNYWLHSGHLHLKGDEKMSKSLKNTISIQDFLSVNSADNFRMYCLLSGYRNNVEYSEQTFSNAKAVCKRIKSFLTSCDSYIKGICFGGQLEETVVLKQIAHTRQKLLSSLADDFDTAKAMGILMDFISITNQQMIAKSEDETLGNQNSGAIAAASSFIEDVTSKLGLSFLRNETIYKDDSSQILNIIVNFRSEVRELALRNLKEKSISSKESEKLLRACDKLRSDLNIFGIEINDHGKKAAWSLKQKL